MSQDNVQPLAEVFNREWQEAMSQAQALAVIEVCLHRALAQVRAANFGGWRHGLGMELVGTLQLVQQEIAKLNDRHPDLPSFESIEISKERSGKCR